MPKNVLDLNSSENVGCGGRLLLYAKAVVVAEGTISTKFCAFAYMHKNFANIFPVSLNVPQLVSN